MLPIGSTIGILGGGQLGRMLSVAAAQLGFKCHVYEPEKNPPAGETSAILTTALYTDYTALEKFAKSVDVVTFEFENIPSKTLDYIESIVEIFPDRKALKISQDRLFEKNFLTKLGLETAPYLKVDDVTEFKDAVKKIGTPAILKTRTMGYDGKGQVKITNEDQVKQISKTFKTSNHILEGLVDFTKEISVISVRNSKGEISCFDPGENLHENGVLKTTTIPAQFVKKFKCKIVPIYIERIKDINFKLTIHKPLIYSDDESIESITQNLNSLLEKLILKNPEQWIWSHNRWK